MTAIDPLKLAGAKSKGKRPWFLETRDDERLMNILLSVVQEVSVVRERLDTIERLLEEKGSVTRADIEAYVPDTTAAAERGAWTQEYLARVFRVLQQEHEDLIADDEASEDVAEDLARN